MPKLKPRIVQRDDLSMMRNIGAWPRWPWLPIKKRGSGGNMPECALLHADHVLDGKPRVFFANLFQTGWFPHPDFKFVEFDSLDAILAAGWEID